tara:strand:+ start:2509 stop:2745 length:237 start_codon:yes stop_codon:yes gene_type:complete
MSRSILCRKSCQTRHGGDWVWSPARAYLAGDDNDAVKVPPVLERVGDFVQFPGEPFNEDAGEANGPGSHAVKEGQKAK